MNAPFTGDPNDPKLIFNTADMMAALTDRPGGEEIKDHLLEGKVAVFEYNQNPAQFVRPEGVIEIADGKPNLKEIKSDMLKPVIDTEAFDELHIACSSRFQNSTYCFMARINPTDKSKIDCIAVDVGTNTQLNKEAGIVSPNTAIGTRSLPIRINLVQGHESTIAQEMHYVSKEGQKTTFGEVVKLSPEVWTAKSFEEALETRARMRADYISPQFAEVEKLSPIAKLTDVVKAVGTWFTDIASKMLGDKGRQK